MLREHFVRTKWTFRKTDLLTTVSWQAICLANNNDDNNNNKDKNNELETDKRNFKKITNNVGIKNVSW